MTVEAGPAPGVTDRLRTTLARGLRELSEVDRAVYETISRHETPVLDAPMRRLSNAADRSVVWLGISAALAGLGGPEGRRAASRGLVSIGIASGAVNLGLKFIHQRRRPIRPSRARPWRDVRMPGSTSFPSGHSASAFAFATAVGTEVPALALPLGILAAGVAYSRVHTGVHYPADVVAGSLFGAIVGQLVVRAMDRATRPDVLEAAVVEVARLGDGRRPVPDAPRESRAAE